MARARGAALFVALTFALTFLALPAFAEELVFKTPGNQTAYLDLPAGTSVINLTISGSELSDLELILYHGKKRLPWRYTSTANYCETEKYGRSWSKRCDFVDFKVNLGIKAEDISSAKLVVSGTADNGGPILYYINRNCSSSFVRACSDTEVVPISELKCAGSIPSRTEQACEKWCWDTYYNNKTAAKYYEIDYYTCKYGCVGKTYCKFYDATGQHKFDYKWECYEHMCADSQCVGEWYDQERQNCTFGQAGNAGYYNDDPFSIHTIEIKPSAFKDGINVFSFATIYHRNHNMYLKKAVLKLRLNGAYPSGLAVDIGADGTADWQLDGELQGEVSKQLSVNNCMEGCRLAIAISSESVGIVKLSANAMVARTVDYPFVMAGGSGEQTTMSSIPVGIQVPPIPLGPIVAATTITVTAGAYAAIELNRKLAEEAARKKAKEQAKAALLSSSTNKTQGTYGVMLNTPNGPILVSEGFAAKLKQALYDSSLPPSGSSGQSTGGQNGTSNVTGNTTQSWIIRNSNAIKKVSDAVGWTSLGVVIGGALLMLTGFGAPAGAAMIVSGFTMSAASGVVDIAVSTSRMRANTADTDDYLRFVLSPLAFIPAGFGKGIGQLGKQGIKFGIKQAGKFSFKDAVTILKSAFKEFPDFGKNIKKYSVLKSGPKNILGETIFNTDVRKLVFGKSFATEVNIFMSEISEWAKRAGLKINDVVKYVTKHEALHAAMVESKQFWKKTFGFLPKKSTINEIIRTTQISEDLADLVAAIRYKGYNNLLRILNRSSKSFERTMNLITTFGSRKGKDFQRLARSIDNIALKNLGRKWPLPLLAPFALINRKGESKGKKHSSWDFKKTTSSGSKKPTSKEFTKKVKDKTKKAVSGIKDFVNKGATVIKKAVTSIKDFFKNLFKKK
ncbi:MAG: hypothetical protein QW751_01060 [Candidatus Aenigmatarchaeota archaeon]|nr:hypothetical protein [Candidatus Aenigmarchaeota archaeon]